MSGLLEVFNILFQSNAEDLKKGAEDAKKVVDGLEDTLLSTDKVTEQLGKAFDELTKSAKKSIVRFLGFAAIVAGIKGITQQTDEIGKFSKALGENVEEIDAWSEAASRFRGSGEAFRGSIKSLIDQLAELQLTGGGTAVEVFARLGISAFDAAGKTRPVLDILLDVARSFEELTEAESVNFGQKLGLDQATILLLQQGRSEVINLVNEQRKLGITTKEDTEIASDFSRAWLDFIQVLKELGRLIGAIVLPVLTLFLNAIKSITIFLRNNKNLVTGFFIGVAIVLTAVYLPAVITATTATLAFVASLIAAASPFLLIAGIIVAIAAAFAVLYQDIVAFIQGNDSLIGLLVDKFPLVKKIVDAISDSFKFLKQTISAILSDNFEELPESLQKALEKSKEKFLEFNKFIIFIFKAIRNFIKESFDLLKNPLRDIFKIGGNLSKFLGFGTDSESDIIPSTGNLLPEQMRREMIENQNILRGVMSAPLSSQTSSSIVNATNNRNQSLQTSIGQVNVDARGGDSRDVANNVGLALKDQMEQALSDFDDGVAA